MNDVQSGLEGVVAFATRIAEPDRDGGALRYRGVDIEDLVGAVPFERVWGLLVDASFDPGLAFRERTGLPLRTGDIRVDLQAALAAMGAAWRMGQLIDIDGDAAREDCARLSAAALGFVAQSARGADLADVPAAELDGAGSAAEHFLIAWRGEA